MQILGICADATSDKRLRAAILLYTPISILNEEDPSAVPQLITEFEQMSRVVVSDDLHDVYCAWLTFFKEYNGKITFTTKERQEGYYLITKFTIT
jgi:hypothetical protein